jgi:hypothetical protein|tara:strand:+ start:4043 stop:4267 length:225 start_codon:yes stop_codon:yes gene_type:complete
LYSAHVCGALDVPFERVDFDFSRTGSDMICINTESSTFRKFVRMGVFEFGPERSLNPTLVTVFPVELARNAKGE